MGARNHSGVQVMWGHLPDGAYRLLGEMAHTALDEDRINDAGTLVRARRFFGGVDMLVTFVRSHNDRGEERTYAARKSAAFRFLAQLIEAGAVKIVRPATNHGVAEYALNCDPTTAGRETFDAIVARSIDRRPQKPGESDPDGPVDDTPADGTRVRASRTPQSPSQSDTAESEPVGPQSPSQSDTPSKEPSKEPIEGTKDKEKSPEVSTSPAAVDDSEHGELTTEQANRELVTRYGLEYALRLLDEHAATCDCANPAAHALALAVPGALGAPDESTRGGVTPSLLAMAATGARGAA